MKVALCILDDNDKILSKNDFSCFWDHKLELMMQNLLDKKSKLETCQIIVNEIISQINTEVIYGMFDETKKGNN